MYIFVCMFVSSYDFQFIWEEKQTPHNRNDIRVKFNKFTANVMTDKTNNEPVYNLTFDLYIIICLYRTSVCIAFFIDFILEINLFYLNYLFVLYLLYIDRSISWLYAKIIIEWYSYSTSIVRFYVYNISWHLTCERKLVYHHRFKN